MIVRWFSRNTLGKAYGHLHPGRHYRVERDFRDHDGRLHRQGQQWRYRTYTFLPYEDGLSLFFLTKDGDDPYIESNRNGLKFLVLFMNCEENKNCKTLQNNMGFSDAKEVTIERLNQWNKDKRFARAYRDDAGDPVLEMDVDLDFAGIPRENVGETFNTWSSLMDSFREYVFEK